MKINKPIDCKVCNNTGIIKDFNPPGLPGIKDVKCYNCVGIGIPNIRNILKETNH